MRLTKTLLNAALGGAVLLGGILLPSATAQARDGDDQCFRRIRKEEFKLQRDIDRHGSFSRQAEHRRAKVRELRERCAFEHRGRFWGDGDHDRDDRSFRNGRHRHHGDGDNDRDDRWRDRDDQGRGRWHHGDHDRDD